MPLVASPNEHVIWRRLGTGLPPRWKSVPNHCFEVPDDCLFPCLMCCYDQLPRELNNLCFGEIFIKEDLTRK